MMDVTRMMQNGTWSGWVEVDGVRHELSRSVSGYKRPIMGSAPVGLPDAQPNPAATDFSFLDLGTDEL